MHLSKFQTNFNRSSPSIKKKNFTCEEKMFEPLHPQFEHLQERVPFCIGTKETIALIIINTVEFRVILQQVTQDTFK